MSLAPACPLGHATSVSAFTGKIDRFSDIDKIANAARKTEKTTTVTSLFAITMAVMNLLIPAVGHDW